MARNRVLLSTVFAALFTVGIAGAQVALLAGAVLIGAPKVASAQQFTVIALPETSATFPAGTTLNNPPYTSQTDDPAGPFQNQSVWFKGFLAGGSDETNSAGGHLVYRVQLQFAQDVSVTSITVGGFGDYVSCGAGPMLRFLDQNRAVLGALFTAGVPSGQLTNYTLSLTGAATGRTFFVDEFDCSTDARYRQYVTLNLRPTAGVVVVSGDPRK